MINVMHGCEPYGHLAENGVPMPDERIARKCGATVQEYVTLLAELEAAGVPRRTRAGIIYSKRMVEDRQKRDEWRKRQRKHRTKDGSCHAPVTRDDFDAAGVPGPTRAEIISQNGVVEDQEKRDEWPDGQQKHRDAGGSSHAPVTPMSRPSSSSFASPSPKKENPTPFARNDQAKIQGAEPSPTVEKDARAQKSPVLTEQADATHFAQFAEAYPPEKSPTSPELEDAFKIWQRLSVREQLWAIKSLTSWKQHWEEDLPKFIPEMINFLRKKRWEQIPPKSERQKGKKNARGNSFDPAATAEACGFRKPGAPD
ncbi:MAG: hypothetical protein WAN12_18815 [Candidatus Acidiferrum sp.]